MSQISSYDTAWEGKRVGQRQDMKSKGKDQMTGGKERLSEIVLCQAGGGKRIEGRGLTEATPGEKFGGKTHTGRKREQGGRNSRYLAFFVFSAGEKERHVAQEKGRTGAARGKIRKGPIGHEGGLKSLKFACRDCRKKTTSRSRNNSTAPCQKCG